MTPKLDKTAANHALLTAAETAARAPSIHNTQPWHWQIHHGAADLHADLRRHLPINDPDRRMLTISCGAALHHAEIALAAQGITYDLTLTPDPTNPNHLAHLQTTGTTPITPQAIRTQQTTELRHTDRRPLLDQNLPPETLTTLRSAAAHHRIGLDPLTHNQMIELAAATARAQHDQTNDQAALAELTAWTGHHRPPFAGIPDTTIPNHPPQTTVPARDFGHVGTLPIPDTHDHAATYAILYGMNDEPTSWLQAGQALSDIWLTATQHGIALVPLSAAAEQPSTRHQLRRILAGIGYPYLAIRLGIADPNHPPPPPTPRLKPQTTIETLD